MIYLATIKEVRMDATIHYFYENRNIIVISIYKHLVINWYTRKKSVSTSIEYNRLVCGKYEPIKSRKFKIHLPKKRCIINNEHEVSDILISKILNKL